MIYFVLCVCLCFGLKQDPEFELSYSDILQYGIDDEPAVLSGAGTDGAQSEQACRRQSEQREQEQVVPVCPIKQIPEVPSDATWYTLLYSSGYLGQQKPYMRDEFFAGDDDDYVSSDLTDINPKCPGPRSATQGRSTATTQQYKAMRIVKSAKLSHFWCFSFPVKMRISPAKERGKFFLDILNGSDIESQPVPAWLARKLHIVLQRSKSKGGGFSLSYLLDGEPPQSKENDEDSARHLVLYLISQGVVVLD